MSNPPRTANAAHLAVLVFVMLLPLGRHASGQDPQTTGAPVASPNPVTQEPASPKPAGQQPGPQNPTAEQTSYAAVKGLVEAMEARRAEVEAAATQARAALEAKDDAQHRAALEAGARASAALAALRRQFESVVSEVGIEVFEGEREHAFELQREIEGVLKPLVQQLKDATAAPREISRLEIQIEAEERRRRLAAAAIERIAARQSDPRYAMWTEHLEAASKAWSERLREASNEKAVARQQLQQRREQQRSFVDAMADFVNTFFRSRGLNLALGVAAFALVLFGLRFARRAASRLEPFRRRGRLTFYGRLFGVVYQVFVVVAAGSAMLLAFYVTSDWMLLVLAGVFLLGLAWASLRLLPQFFEQVRLLLNVGSVREGERITRDGIPWRVERLKLYTNLINPKLTGGMLRLPVRDLIGQHSRPLGSDEVWFPTSRGDWVKFEDGSRAEVLSQSPDLVQLRQLGGALITCRTAEFIGMMMRNLSTGFRLRLTFGVDYQHQAECTDKIPALMQARLHAAMSDLVGAENIVKIGVEFKEAGASSLDYDVLGDFRGEVAASYDRVQRAMARVLVEACNEHGWVIPFTQVTLHNAPASV